MLYCSNYSKFGQWGAKFSNQAHCCTEGNWDSIEQNKEGENGYRAATSGLVTKASFSRPFQWGNDSFCMISRTKWIGLGLSTHEVLLCHRTCHKEGLQKNINLPSLLFLCIPMPLSLFKLWIKFVFLHYTYDHSTLDFGYIMSCYLLRLHPGFLIYRNCWVSRGPS